MKPTPIFFGLALATLLGACSPSAPPPAPAVPAPVTVPAPAPTPTPTPAPVQPPVAAAPAPTSAPASAPASATAPASAAQAPSAPAPVAKTGFDPAAVAVATPVLPPWPYVGVLEGYEKLSVKNRPGDSARDLQRDVAFDRYEFFDGQQLVGIEGRRMTGKFIGTGASFFQAKKNYETVLKGMGGVTVFEGTGKAMEQLKLKYGPGTHRGRYVLAEDQMAVYFLRTPDKEIWVEVYAPWDTKDDYWLTVVEKKALDVTLKAVPADEMKKALDANGRIALYINFDTDKSTLKPDGNAVVLEIVKLLNTDKALTLLVEGHTDAQGTLERNLALSDARAKAVVAALAAQGVAADRLQAKGFGQSKPIADNSQGAGRAKNRRVELVKL